MKQNLIQKQLKFSQQKRTEHHEASDDQFSEHDLTNQAFYILRELLETKYAFTKKSLANFLYGKQVVLQQKNNEQPPSVLKGYMNLYELESIEEMIEVMIRVNVLKEEMILLQKRSSMRLFATKKYDQNLFPKVIINIRSKARSESIIKKQNQANSEMTNSRLANFVQQKNNLPINEEKRQEQMRIKAEKQRRNKQEWKRLQEEEFRQKIQHQKRQKQKIQEQEKQRARKQEEKKNIQSQMNSFWMKERQKIEQFVCPKNDISLLDSPDIRKSKMQKQQAQEKVAIQNAGHVLQVQMKQLKEKEEERKNPIKPIVSWSFMKNNIDHESSQSSEKSIKKQNRKSVNFLEEEKPQNKRIYQSYLKVQQKRQCMDSFSESTQVTQTNYKLKSRLKKQKTQPQKQPSPELKQKPIRPFAQNFEQSIFSNNFYCNRRSTESIPQNNKHKLIKNINLQNKQNQHEIQFFSFKRKKPEFEQELQQTITIAKRPASRTSSFEELGKVLKRSSNQWTNTKQQLDHYESKDSQTDEQQFFLFSPSYTQTKTIAMPKKITQKRYSFHDTRRVSFRQESPCTDMDLFSQTISMPEPIRKNQKTSTKDLRNFAQTQPVVKRDSFAQELIDNYMKRK